MATADKRIDEAGSRRPRRVEGPAQELMSTPEPVVLEYRRALYLKGFSGTVEVRARPPKTGKVKVSFRGLVGTPAARS